VTGAALPVCGSTAWQALDLLDLPVGATLLVLGAGGAVGGFAVQRARRRSMRVLGTAGPDDHERLHGYGAEELADSHGDWVAALQSSGPADGLLDLVGPDELHKGFDLLADGAAVVTSLPGLEREAPARGGTLQFVGSRGDTAVLTGLSALADAGRLHVDIAEVDPFDDLVQALQQVRSPHPPGKIVLDLTAGAV
jgi:NADPH:quinone reductase-like Zn-dependent oxidoreductase